MSILSGLKLNAHQQMVASLPSDFPDSFFCGPSDVNGAALCSDSVVPGPGVRNPKKSNVDLTGKKSVRKGCLVSWGGLRFTVLRVEGGRAYYGESFSNSVACGLVQVVG